MIDNDGNDKIDWEEVKDFYEAMELDYETEIDPKIKDDMHEMFLQIDSDKDGEVDREEYEQAVRDEQGLVKPVLAQIKAKKSRRSQKKARNVRRK